jgi:hypothetical protein
MVEKRGRKAAADLEVVPLMPGDAKPPAPEDMTEREADAWTSIVNAMPLRWFGRDCQPVLRALCRHIVAEDILWVRYLAALEGREHEDEVLSTAQLSAVHARETLAIRRLSADLRLTPMARMTNQRVETSQTIRQQQRVGGMRPWEG